MFLFVVLFKLCSKHLDLVKKLVGAGFDGHASTVDSEREQDVLAPHSLDARNELNLADGEVVSGMEGAVHVRVGKASRELWVLSHSLAAEVDWRGTLVVHGASALNSPPSSHFR